MSRARPDGTSTAGDSVRQSVRRLGGMLLCATVAALSAAPAAARRPPDPRLGRADLRLRLESPIAARGELRYRIESPDDELVLLWSHYPGQRLEALAIRVDGGEVRWEFIDDPAADRADVRRLAVSMPARRSSVLVEIDYRIRVPRAYRYRYPVPVPEALPGADRRSVRLRVELPPGTSSTGDLFPRLRRLTSRTGEDRGGELLGAELIGVPSLVRAGFRQGPPGIDRGLLIEVAAVGALLLPLGLWLALRRRRRARG